MRKEKSKLETDLETQKSALENAATLLEQIKAMHKICLQAESTIKKLSDKKKDPIKLPEFDVAAFESLEQALAKE